MRLRGEPELVDPLGGHSRTLGQAGELRLGSKHDLDRVGSQVDVSPIPREDIPVVLPFEGVHVPVVVFAGCIDCRPASLLLAG
jgi:hypothetical protein